MKRVRKTPTKEQKEWMKENGYTEKDLDKFWTEAYPTNHKIRLLSSQGITWRDMNLSVVKQLPTQKERDLESLRQKQIEEEALKRQQEYIKKQKEYYAEHFEEIMVENIDMGIDLIAEELRRIVNEYEIDTQYHENRRWLRGVTTIVKLLDRYFSIDWDEGLTEMQENEYWNQPIEVEKHEYEKTITVTEWRPINKEK